MDRNPASKTYGCLDRTFWHYKKTDMAMSSLQSGVYSLALLYKKKLSHNPYHQNQKVLQWILAEELSWQQEAGQERWRYMTAHLDNSH
jgi:hypothetical protein